MILSSPTGNHGFVPPFIVLMSINSKEDPLSNYRARILFTRECAVPSQQLMQLCPDICGKPSCQCVESGCGFMDMPRQGNEKAWVLATNGGLVSDVSRSVIHHACLVNTLRPTPRE